jgi:hypothetical protein
MALIGETGEKRGRDKTDDSAQYNNPLSLHHDDHLPYETV